MTDRSLTQAAFSQAMIHWLQGKEWQVGVTGRGVEADRELELAKSLLPVAAQVLGLGPLGALVTPFLSSGSSADEVEAALTPYVPICDLLALHRNGNELIVLIYGDELSTDDTRERLTLVREFSGPLKRLGGPMERLTVPWVIPLLVYFRDEQCLAHDGVLSEHGWGEHGGVKFESYAINARGQEVIRYAAPSTATAPTFDDEDLFNVLALVRISDRKGGTH